jgi:hypothetical protein
LEEKLLDIESIEFESFNLLNTIFLGVGIAALAFIAFVVIIVASGEFGYKGT